MSQSTCLQPKSTLLFLCLLFTAAAAAHCSCPQPNSLPPVGSRFLFTAVHFLPPDLLDLADSHTCPQSSTAHSLPHSLTHLPSSPLLHVDLLAAFRGASVYCVLLCCCTCCVPPSVLPSLYLCISQHIRSLCPSLTTIIFSARRYTHNIMHHYFFVPSLLR